MCYSNWDVRTVFSREVLRKREMCYRKRRRRLPMDGYWRPVCMNALKDDSSIESLFSEINS